MKKLSQKLILKKIVKRLSLVNDVKAVILYGSFARGDFGPKSDIDILILTTKPETHTEIQDKIIGLDVKRNIRPTIRTLSELKQTDNGLLQNIFQDGKIIYLKEPMDIKASLLLNQKPYAIYTFDLTGLEQKTKAKFNRELYQRKPKGYSYDGILQEIGGRKLSKGCILVAYEKKGIIDKFFRKYKLDPYVIKVWK
ncbi:MAG: nucleotidyltransferase domain-containing protein [Thermodesulfobacteriota bacterium]|nr:nucleotidyltransferase domain-containing protein [Thermodesulfobacteriota bacterium]